MNSLGSISISPVRSEFSISSIRLVPLHPDLVNEPFSYRDTGVRPEIIVQRPFYSFRIMSQSDDILAISSVDDTVIYVANGDNYGLPQKASTTFSIVNAYDSYGLEVA